MSVPVQRLAESARPHLLQHFLNLAPDDVRLRFGSHLAPEAISSYVAGIDFASDAVVGVYDHELALSGVAHVAFNGNSAELGVSVLPGHRGQGIGSALFMRAAEHARDRFITRIYMHCLADNAAMIHIARKAGMAICVEQGEADAFIDVPHADAMSLAGEFFGQRLALLDYTLKQHTAALKRITVSLGAKAE